MPPTPQIQTLTELIRSYSPILRFEETPEGHLLVQGYCFVNPKAGDGWDLERATMIDATPDYLTNGSIREMHRKDGAAGTPLSAVWDKTGCYLSALVVDPVAKEKVKTGTYKGFSVGIRPEIVRGDKVKKATWIENSLVDRPQDKDATIDKWEITHAENADAPYEVQVYAETDDLAEILRAAAPLSYQSIRDHTEAANTHYNDWPQSDKIRNSMEMLRSSLAGIAGSKVANKEELTRKSVSQFADHIAPYITGDATAAERSFSDFTIQRQEDNLDLPTLARVMAEDGEDARAVRAVILGNQLERIEAVEAFVSTVETLITRAVAPLGDRITALAKTPMPVNLPALHPGAVERTFANGNPGAQQQKSEADILTARYGEICTRISTESNEGKRTQLISERMIVRNQLRQHGVVLP